MNMLGIQLLSLPTSNKSQLKKKAADNPYASLHFSGIFFSKEKRDDAGKTVAQVQNTAEAGAKVAGKTTGEAAKVGFITAAVPVVALNYLLGGAQRGSNESFIHTMTEEESNDYVSDRDVNNGLGWG
jgi:hypothetical protein